MVTVDSIQRLLSAARRLSWIVIVLVLVVLAGAIFLTTKVLRESIRKQIASRDGEVLYAVAILNAESVAEELAEFEELGSLEDPIHQLTVLFRTSELRQVLGARLFDVEGQFVDSQPVYVMEKRLDADALEGVLSRQPISRFHAKALWGEYFYPVSTNATEVTRREPILEVNVPLHDATDGPIYGVAQFLMEGKGLAQELARLDRHLWLLASVAFVAAGSLLVVTLAAAFRRTRRTQELLANRTESLMQANRELALAAKSSAVGAVTAHLIHGLKNPLSGLQNFVSGLSESDTATFGPEWKQAVASTRRMQTMINQVVQVIKEQDGTRQYEISLQELIDIVIQKTESVASETGAQLSVSPTPNVVFSNRVANLLTLILVNLIQNALQASGRGRTVRVDSRLANGCVSLSVQDQGPGFPEALKPSLFSPCQSAKEGGSGIGLTISKLLANHLGADLELQQSGADGCIFRLVLPPSLFTGQSTVASSGEVR